MEEIVGEVKTIAIGKDASGVITFIAKREVFIDDVVRLTHEEKSFSFAVNSVSATNDRTDLLVASATEIGNWRFKLNRRKIDARDILNKELTLISDPEVIRKLREAESYC
jgi:hypothetical protein